MVPPNLKLVKSSVDDSRLDIAPAAAPDPADEDAALRDALARLEAGQAAAQMNESLRVVEALLFSASGPLDEATLARPLPPGSDVAALLAELQSRYSGRGITLNRVAGKWAFRTAQDLSYLMERHTTEERKLSKAALETLAIIAYHQPVTRAEVEDIRGVSTSKGTLDVLLETGWIRPRGRRRAPGRPVTYGTTEGFLDHFSLDTIKDLPGLAELKGAGLLDGNLPPGFSVPDPTDVAALMPDELPLDAVDGSEEPEPEDDPDLFAALPDEDEPGTPGTREPPAET